LVWYFWAAFLQIVYITFPEINQMFTCPMLYFRHMAKNFKTYTRPSPRIFKHRHGGAGMKNSNSGILDIVRPGHRKPGNGGNGDSKHAPFRDDKYFHLLAENARDLIFHTQISPSRRFIYVSPSCTHITGYTPQEFYADPHLPKKCIHQDDFHLVANPSLPDTTQKSKPVDVRWIRKDGRVIWLEHMITLLRDARGNPESLLIIARDVTERKRMEKALRESEEKFSAAFRSSPDMIIIHDLKERKYLEVNDSFLNNTGYTREELIGHSVDEVNMWVKQEDADRMNRLMQEQGKIRNEEYDLRIKSGEIHTWLCSADIINIGGEKRVLAVATDITERKKAREALRESEEKFSKAFNASPFSISITRLSDGKFIEVNDSFLRDKGYTREEIIGHRSKKLRFWVNHDEAAEKIMLALKSGGQVHNEQLQYRTKTGYIRTGLVSADIINIGNEPCILTINYDVTQQKQAEEQLRLLSSVTQQVSDATIITDRHFNITYINQAAQDLFGYTIEEVRGKPLDFFNTKPASQEIRKSITNNLTRGKVWRGTTTKKHKNGNTLTCDCYISPLYDENGKIFSYIDVQRDVSKQKEMETKLQTQKQLVESILATMTEGVLVIDNKDQIILANTAFHKIFNLHKKSTKNRPLNEVLPGDQFFDLHRAVKCGDKENSALEFRYQVQEFEKIILCIIVKMDGQRTLLTFADITREREEEEKLYLTDRLASIGEMAAGLAHELNNPLTGILALSQMLISSDIPEEHKEDLECIRDEAKRATSIVKNVLLFARNKTDESGQASINEVIKDVLRLREYEERASNIRVVTDLEKNLPYIPIDKGQLQQVFLNILSNAEAAIKEVNRPGIITVATQRINNHVNILFSDNGCGIKKQVMPRIFDPFFTTKEVGKGTGLGLSICYSIIVKHGGKISVKSQVNEGTTFTIKMPVTMPED
jgi:PAS domain S-box-containing protein